MKKFKKIILSLVAMTFLMSTTVFAATADETLASVKAKLTAAGLAPAYVDQVATYLTQNPITEAQANTNTIIGSKTDASQLTEAEKNEIKAKIQLSASAVGLVLSKDGENVVILDAKGNTVYKTTLTEMTNVTKTLDPQTFVTNFVEAVVLAQDYSKLVTGSTTTQATAMKKTATNNGNILALGLGVLALAGSVFVVSKKVLA